MLGENWKGLWSLHEFGLTWEAALVSQGDAESMWDPLAQIRARPEPLHNCQGFKQLPKDDAGILVLSEENFTFLF